MSPDPAMFSCTADGVPRPDITWWRVSNGTEMEVMENSNIRISTIALNDCLITSVLTFTETQPILSGVYICMATNSLESAREVGELTADGECLLPYVLILDI